MCVSLNMLKEETVSAFSALWKCDEWGFLKETIASVLSVNGMTGSSVSAVWFFSDGATFIVTFLYHFFPIFPFYPPFPFFHFTFPDSYCIEAIVQKRITRVVRSLPMAKVWWPVPECSTLTYRSPLALYRVLSDQIVVSLEKAFCLFSISIPCLWCSISSMCSFSGAQWGKTHLLCECSDIALMEAM